VPNNGDDYPSTPRPTARDGAITNRSNASDGVDDDDEAGAAPAPPPDPARGLTPAWALRYFNTESDVAELDHLARAALAQLTAEERVTKDVERQMIDASLQSQLLNPTIAEPAAARLRALTPLFDKAMSAKQARLEDLQISGALADHTGRLWQRVKALGENGRVEFTWQPRDPMLPPQTIHPARVPHVQVSFPGALWGGSNALDALAMRATSALTKPGAAPVLDDQLWLDGSRLSRGRIVPVATNPAGNPPGKPTEITLTPQLPAIAAPATASDGAARPATADEILAAKQRLGPKAGAQQVIAALPEGLSATREAVLDVLRANKLLGAPGRKAGWRKQPPDLP
jgi:hypothetical protein